MATQFFSASEIRELESWPVEVGRDELVQYFQLATEDVKWVHRTTRGASNKLASLIFSSPNDHAVDQRCCDENGVVDATVSRGR